MTRRIVVRIAGDTDVGLTIRVLEVVVAGVRNPLVIGVEASPGRYVAVNVRVPRKIIDNPDSGPGAAFA